MQSKRYSWHPCVHCHGYLVHLQQIGPWPDTAAPGTHSSLVHRFSTSPNAAVLLENLKASNSEGPNINLPKVFFSLYSVSKCAFWQTNSSKNSRQFFQQAVINSTPARTFNLLHFTWGSSHYLKIWTWKFSFKSTLMRTLVTTQLSVWEEQRFGVQE